MGYSPGVDIEELLDVAHDIADKASEYVISRRNTRLEIETKSSAIDLVTEVDKDTEALIVAALRLSRPNDSIVGEEGASYEGNSGISWIIDPIDGTTSFVYGQSGFSISIAALYEEETVIGLVDAPALGQRYWAALNKGAYISTTQTAPTDGKNTDSKNTDSKNADSKNTEGATEIKVSGETQLSQSLIGTGLAYLPELRQHQANILAELVTKAADIRRIGSAALELCHVAAAKTDGFYEHNLAPWDYAAGILIAREAGARVVLREKRSQSTGSPVDDSSFVIVATPEIFAELKSVCAPWLDETVD